MNALTTEIKTRARLLQKLLETGNVAARKQAIILSRQRRWELPEHWQLKHCMNLAAADAGFHHWEHARIVLGGAAEPGDDMGDLWHGKEVNAFVNHWYATHAQAQARIQYDARSYLLPYRRQFVVVTPEYLHALGVSTEADLWQPIGRDVAAGYGTATWLKLVQQRLQRSRAERFNASWNATQTMLDLESTAAETQRVMKSFVREGRLLAIPEQRKKRLVILRWLVEQLQPGMRYEEKDINTFLLQFHEDFATLRREFIVNALMQREDGWYWRI